MTLRDGLNSVVETLWPIHVMIKLTYSVCALPVCHLLCFKGRADNIPASGSRHHTHFLKVTLKIEALLLHHISRLFHLLSGTEWI